MILLRPACKKSWKSKKKFLSDLERIYTKYLSKIYKNSDVKNCNESNSNGSYEFIVVIFWCEKNSWIFIYKWKKVGHSNATAQFWSRGLDKWTHKALFVWDVVCQLQFVKWDNFLHPLFPRGRGIGMNVHSLWHFRIGFAGNYPSTENK